MFDNKNKRLGKKKKKVDVVKKHDGVVRAVCVETYDNRLCKQTELKKGDVYTLEYAVIWSGFTDVYLKEFNDKLFNSVLFRFYVNGYAFGLVNDVRILLKLPQPNFYKNAIMAHIIKYPMATEKGLKYLRKQHIYSLSPIITRTTPGKKIMLPRIPDYELDTLVRFATDGWKLGKCHGLSHWEKVERNAFVLSLEYVNGRVSFREDVNLKVVCYFAYLHDKCRINDWEDLEHGARAADMLHTFRDTLLKDFTDEEFSLLEKACRYHTTELRCGNSTIDVCFDADRLDLGRVGITPAPDKMATLQGVHYAGRLSKYEYSPIFTMYYGKIQARNSKIL